MGAMTDRVEALLGSQLAIAEQMSERRQIISPGSAQAIKTLHEAAQAERRTDKWDAEWRAVDPSGNVPPTEPASSAQQARRDAGSTRDPIALEVRLVTPWEPA